MENSLFKRGRSEDCLAPTAVYLIGKDVFAQAEEGLAASGPVSAAVCCTATPPTS